MVGDIILPKVHHVFNVVLDFSWLSRSEIDQQLCQVRKIVRPLFSCGKNQWSKQQASKRNSEKVDNVVSIRSIKTIKEHTKVTF